METAIDIMKQDPNYLKNRRRELQQYLDLFSRQLFHFYSIAPAVIRLDLKTGEFFSGTTVEWQTQIDKLRDEQMIFLQATFPEFYKPNSVSKSEK